jgi:hypothetical protein
MELRGAGKGEQALSDGKTCVRGPVFRNGLACFRMRDHGYARSRRRADQTKRSANAECRRLARMDSNIFTTLRVPVHSA